MKKLKGTRKITGGIILAVIAALIAWDIFVVVEPTDGDTISEVTLDWATEHSFIPIAAGVLCGHLFWPANFSKKRKKWSLVGLIGVGTIAAVLDVVGVLGGIPPIIMFVLGIVGGHFGWSQNKKIRNTK